MKINEAFPTKYLAAADLSDCTVSVIIDCVQMEEIGEDQNKSEKPIVYFRGKQKGLVLNKTNATTIAGMHGDDTDNWIGKTILLWPTQTEFQGRAVACIRVKLQQSRPQPVAPGAVKPLQTEPIAQAEEFIENIKAGDQDVLPEDDVPF